MYIIYIYMYLFIYLLIYWFIYLFIYLLTYLFTYLFIYLFMYLFIIITILFMEEKKHQAATFLISLDHGTSEQIVQLNLMRIAFFYPE